MMAEYQTDRQLIWCTRRMDSQEVLIHRRERVVSVIESTKVVVESSFANYIQCHARYPLCHVNRRGTRRLGGNDIVFPLLRQLEKHMPVIDR